MLCSRRGGGWTPLRIWQDSFYTPKIINFLNIFFILVMPPKRELTYKSSFIKMDVKNNLITVSLDPGECIIGFYEPWWGFWQFVSMSESPGSVHPPPPRFSHWYMHNGHLFCRKSVVIQHMFLPMYISLILTYHFFDNPKFQAFSSLK